MSIDSGASRVLRFISLRSVTSKDSRIYRMVGIQHKKRIQACSPHPFDAVVTSPSSSVMFAVNPISTNSYFTGRHFCSDSPSGWGSSVWAQAAANEQRVSILYRNWRDFLFPFFYQHCFTPCSHAAHVSFWQGIVFGCAMYYWCLSNVLVVRTCRYSMICCVAISWFAQHLFVWLLSAELLLLFINLYTNVQ